MFYSRFSMFVNLFVVFCPIRCLATKSQAFTGDYLLRNIVSVNVRKRLLGGLCLFSVVFLITAVNRNYHYIIANGCDCCCC